MKQGTFEKRLARHLDELRWLYMELYDNGSMFAELCETMRWYAENRRPVLRRRDDAREQDPGWYKRRDLLGMMLYIDNFAGDLNGVRDKLDYLEEAGVNCLHLMPFLDTVPERSDGGYAVADFRKVRPDLGTMEDLQALTDACHRRGMNVCMDFVMNHTSSDHEWARRARAGDGEYQSRYFFFADPAIPAAYEKTVPQVFPTTAPGNFTWLPDCGHWVMTTFYPYQWDLNYHNPRVFNEMMYNFLYLANRGIDIIRIDAVPYIWKELGTNCRNLPKVHTIVRMMRMIGEIVCPSVILLGEVVMEPERVVPYFGTVDKPECHLLYNVTTMATTWHTVATGDARLLRRQLDTVAALPKEYVFLNYLRCHDDIGWGLDYPTLRRWGMEEVPHKKYLNDYFLGRAPGSPSRGELYNDDPATGDARFCGTTASMCGLETDPRRAVTQDVTLHALMLFLSGIPMLYSGDEIAQLNDPSYKADPARAVDSRYLHRGRLPWDRAADRHNADTPAGQVFTGLRGLETTRAGHPAFDASADVWTLDTGTDAVLGVGRWRDGEGLVGLFSFANAAHTVPLPEGCFENLLTGAVMKGSAELPPFGFLWLKEVADGKTL